MNDLKNKEIIAANLLEAKDQLIEILESLEAGKDYSEVELKIDLEHAYHHLNYAWNIRNVSEKDLEKLKDEDFVKWSKYPKDEILDYE